MINFKYQIKQNGSWVDGQPADGEWCRKVYQTGHIVEQAYTANASQPAVPQPEYIGAMTVPTSRIVALVGEPFTVKVTCSVAINDTFAVPMQGLYGSEGRTITLNFVDGMAERELTFDKSGEWQVTEEQINVYLADGQKFQFDGLTISVAE